MCYIYSMESIKLWIIFFLIVVLVAINIWETRMLVKNIANGIKKAKDTIPIYKEKMKHMKKKKH